MTPCEKLGYKVGDRFEVCEGAGWYHSFKVGEKLSLMMDDGTEAPLFYSENDKLDQFIPLRSVKPVADVSDMPTLKDPIEYLKAAHADGDMIDPAMMLRECYGITKTERVVVEWSEATKREIKVGDKVRLLRGGDAAPLLGFTNGEIYKVKNITNCVHRCTRLELDSCGFTSPNDVELV